MTHFKLAGYGVHRKQVREDLRRDADAGSSVARTKWRMLLAAPEVEMWARRISVCPKAAEAGSKREAPLEQQPAIRPTPTAPPEPRRGR
jgi:hypothetical protein